MELQRRVKLLGGTGEDSGDYQVGGSSSKHDEDEGGGLLHLMICDLVLAFLWVLTFSMIVIISGGAWFHKAVMYVGAKFLFAWLGIATEGGLYNPLSVLATTLYGGSPTTLLLRISSQLVGSVLGVKLIMRAIPEYRGGPQLNVNVIVGVTVEGFLAFVAMIVNLLLKETEQGFITTTFISSVTRLILCSFGGWLNPSSVSNDASSLLFQSKRLAGFRLGIRKRGSHDCGAPASLLVGTVCINTVQLLGV